MAHCNSCGRFMLPTENVYKRQMYSGQSNRTYYSNRINFSSSSYYSMKNICFDCAKTMDNRSVKNNKAIWTIIFSAIIIGSLYYLFLNQ